MYTKKESTKGKVLVVGTSNCILRYGFSDGLVASINDQNLPYIIVNLSAGASSSSYHLSTLLARKEQFEEATVIILDFIVNDCSYIRRGLLNLADAMMTMSFLLSSIRSITDAPIIVLGFHEKNETISMVRPYISTLIQMLREIDAIYFPINQTLIYYSKQELIDHDYFEDPGHISRLYSYMFGYSLGIYIDEKFLPKLCKVSSENKNLNIIKSPGNNAFNLLKLRGSFSHHEKTSSLRKETIYTMNLDSLIEANSEECFIASISVDARASSALIKLTGRGKKECYFHACFPAGPKLQVKSLHLPMCDQPYKMQIVSIEQIKEANCKPLLHSANQGDAKGNLSIINAMTVSLESYKMYKYLLFPRMILIDLTDKQIHDYFEGWRKAFAPLLGLFDFSTVNRRQYNKIKFSRSTISW